MPSSPAPFIQHVVVLMLENRSFDHMLGDPAISFPRPVDRPSGTEANPDEQGHPVPISFDAPPDIAADPDHSFVGVMQQLTGNPPAPGPIPYPKPYRLTNDGFVRSFTGAAKQQGLHPSYGAVIMRGQPASNVPVLATLAREFAVCDQWFASLPGQTWPNRNFVHAGTSDGEVDIEKRLFTNDTIFDRIDESKLGKKWRIYHDGIAQVWVFPRLWADLTLRGRFRPIDEFAADAARGDLPAYTFIEPRHFGRKGNSQHPIEGSFHAGEVLIRDVYEALVSNRKLWESTLLVVTYDEHGGFYDHRAPDREAVRPDNKASEEGFEFDLYGFRVPAVLVSPWIPAGTVDHTLYDHSSIPASVRQRFAPDTEPLSLREAAAAPFWPTLSLPEPRKDVPAVRLSPDAEAALATVMPVATTFALRGVPVPEALTGNEDAYAWLAFNVDRAIRAGDGVAPAVVPSLFWEDTSAFLVTSSADAAARPRVAAPAGPAAPIGPVVLTDPDRLSAFGQHVARMLHETARREPPPVARRKQPPRSSKRRAPGKRSRR